jgi:hypothetical protein
MPLRVPSLQLPLANSGPALQANRQLALWATQVTSVVNSLGANPGLVASGNPGSAITTLTFSGAAGTIDISALMHFVLGGQSLATVNPPQGFSGPFFMIAANQFSLTSGGNILTPRNNNIELLTNEVVPMVFDGKNWYVGVTFSSNLLNVKIITYANSPYAVAPEDDLIVASAGTAADTVVNLPTATGSGRPLDVKKADANPYNIAVTPAGTDTIDDAANPFNVLVQYGSYTLVDYSMGKWAII